MYFTVTLEKVLLNVSTCISPARDLSQAALPFPAEKPSSEFCISGKPHSCMISLSLVAH